MPEVGPLGSIGRNGGWEAGERTLQMAAVGQKRRTLVRAKL